MVAVDYFLKIPGIKGESQDSKHKEEIDIGSWSWGLANSDAGGIGGGTGKAAFQDFSILKPVDKSSPMLAQGCAMGSHFAEAILAGRRTSDPTSSVDFLRIKLSDVTISSYQSSAQDREAIPAESIPLESLTIRFAKIEYSYTPQKADGTPDTPVRWGWDLKANKKL